MGHPLGVCSWGCPGRLGFAPMRARCDGAAPCRITGILAVPGTQRSWQLGQQEIQCSRRLWQPVLTNSSSILAWRTPLPDREAWQPTVYRVTKSWTLPKQPCTHRCKTFFCLWQLCPGESWAWRWHNCLAWGTLEAPSVQVHRLPPLQELQPHQNLFLCLLWLVIRSPLWPVFLCSSTGSGT